MLAPFDQICICTHEQGACPQDAEVLEQIDRDVMRTHPDMHFFSGADPAAVLHREVPKGTAVNV